jgi:hypothetical protein
MAKLSGKSIKSKLVPLTCDGESIQENTYFVCQELDCLDVGTPFFLSLLLWRGVHPYVV